VRSLDRPDQPDEPRRGEQAGASGPDQPDGRGRPEQAGDVADRPPRSREPPDPDERGRAHEATRTYVTREMAVHSSADGRPDGTEGRSYRDEVPSYLKAWADHVGRWPDKPRPAADRPADPPGCADAVARVHEAEPRFSADTQAIEQENKDKFGGWLAGFEHRLKGEDRLKEKIAAMVKVESNMTAAEALREIPDATRYTFCFQPENYTRGYYDIKERYESRGYEMYYSQNHWTDPEYKGVNTRWVVADGQRFEVQFHTPDSFHAKHEVTHKAYERIRDPSTRRSEKPELHEFQRQVCELIKIPDGATGIPDYRKEGF
jgi:hypothetical protein